MNNFEEKVYAGLKRCSIEIKDSMKIGAAVSGGADSISLLYSLCNILTPLGITLHVITVNHYIRPDEETCGDVDYVVATCDKLRKAGTLISLKVVELKKGEVGEISAQRGYGIEEAARFLRYKAFDKFIEENKLETLCLAHNKNDDYETLLMRFLQGSSVEGLRGILPVREKYSRPLLNISRDEIEDYLNEKNISWRTDCTNLDTAYLRNNIRLNLIPFLNENFENWKTKLDMGALRASEDYQIINEAVNSVHINFDNSVDLSVFMKLSKPLQKRVLLKMCNSISEVHRLSFGFLGDVCDSISSKNEFSKVCENIEIFTQNQKLFVKKYDKKQTDLCFSDIISKEGYFKFPFGSLEVTGKDEAYDFVFSDVRKENQCHVTIHKLPVLVRNYRTGDEVCCKNGNFKKLQDVFTDWQVNVNQKSFIPLIEDLSCKERKIVCVMAGLFGYKNWIVKENF